MGLLDQLIDKAVNAERRIYLFSYLLDHLPMFCPDGLLQLQHMLQCEVQLELVFIKNITKPPLLLPVTLLGLTNNIMPEHFPSAPTKKSKRTPCFSYKLF